MDRILKTRLFARWMDKTSLNDASLLLAVDEMKRGLIDADLGGGVYKKRVPLPGRGKSGGARTIIATKQQGRWIFLLGFAKNEKENTTRDELAALQKAAKYLLERPEPAVEKMIADGDLQEVKP